MVETYTVTVDHEEENEEQISITGSVNGYECAVVLNKLLMADMSKKEKASYKDRQLAQAFVARQQAPPLRGGREITL